MRVLKFFALLIPPAAILYFSLMYRDELLKFIYSKIIGENVVFVVDGRLDLAVYFLAVTTITLSVFVLLLKKMDLRIPRTTMYRGRKITPRIVVITLLPLVILSFNEKYLFATNAIYHYYNFTKSEKVKYEDVENMSLSAYFDYRPGSGRRGGPTCGLTADFYVRSYYLNMTIGLLIPKIYELGFLLREKNLPIEVRWSSSCPEPYFGRMRSIIENSFDVRLN